MGSRVILVPAVIAVILSGCATAPRAVEVDGEVPAVTPASKGSEAAPATEGSVVTPDSSLVYSVSHHRGSSKLVATAGSTGDEVREMVIPKDVSARVTSADGSAVALTDGEPGSSPYVFVPRDRTRIVVARPPSNTWRSYLLDGNFEPEAFSTDGRKLFLIEYLDDEGSRYRVRMMRLGSGRVLPVGRLTKFAPSSMRGTGRVQVYGPDYDVLYTLYTRQPPNYAHQDHDDVHDRRMVHAFVHVLNLRRGWAHCVDLPMPFGMDAPAEELKVSPDGSRLYAGDGRRTAIIDTKKLRTIGVRPVASLPQPDGE